MYQLSFASFEKKIYIEATPEQVYRAWASPAGLCEWFLQEAVFTTPEGRKRAPEEGIAPEDRYTWKWHNWDPSESGLVLEADGGSLVEYEFGRNSKVRVQLSQTKGRRVLVHLRQYDIPTDEESKLRIYTGCSNGWTFWLANLKAWLEHGILLNETQADLNRDPMAGWVYVNI